MVKKKTSIKVILDGDTVKINITGDSLKSVEANKLAFYGVKSSDSAEVKN